MASRQTIQRTIIEDEVRTLANHPTADQVYDAIHEQHPSISKATVYRTLNRLSDEGQLLRVKINNGADHFDHQTFTHYHVRCTECSRVDDVLVPVLGTIDSEAAKVSGYAITGHTLQFDGICPSCQAKAAKASAQLAHSAPTD